MAWLARSCRGKPAIEQNGLRISRWNPTMLSRELWLGKFKIATPIFEAFFENPRSFRGTCFFDGLKNGERESLLFLGA